MQDLPTDEDGATDMLIERAQRCLGSEGFQRIHELATNTLVEDIRRDLSAFSVDYDQWFSET